MLIVQKYGGTSVANVERIKNVAARVARTAKEGHKVVVVVSAMSGETDKMINLAHQVSSNPNEREMDMLLSSGERVTSALTAMAIEDLGCRAMALTGRQMGIITDDVHTKARIAKITGDRAKKALDDGYIIVVAGFQGITENQDVTTLGRGALTFQQLRLQQPLMLTSARFTLTLTVFIQQTPILFLKQGSLKEFPMKRCLSLQALEQRYCRQGLLNLP